jgi:hypothetical protein
LHGGAATNFTTVSPSVCGSGKCNGLVSRDNWIYQVNAETSPDPTVSPATNDRGLKTVGLSVGANAAATNYAIEDMTFKIPLALDRSNLATEFGVDANKGTTLVLDASGKVVASSSDPKKILAIVSKLLSSE